MKRKQVFDGSPASKCAATSEPLCSIGIDFGTSRTGYAFAFKKKNGETPEICIREPGGQDATKTNTVLLLDQRSNFLAFGSKALDAYYEDNRDGTLLLFEKFKMGLHQNVDGGEPQATALNGRKLQLVDVITKSLQYIKDEAVREVNSSQMVPIRFDEIQWLVTVPAIWSDVAKGIMRRAAFKAELIEDESSDRLALALEPEAACVACEAENEALRKGHRFMVLDCGGGTVDITLHLVAEKAPHLQLQEICRPSGGPWGSTFVDAEFEAFVKDLVGAASFARFKPSSQWVELMRVWEGVKLGFDPSQEHSGENCKSVNFSSVLEVIEESSITLSTLVAGYNQKRGTSLRVRGRNILLLSSEMISKFFHSAISKTINHVKELLAEHPVDFIFLVGGFAESKALQHRVRNELETGRLRVVVPPRPGLAVLKGAVMLGLGASERFASRVARCTYAVGTSVLYDAAQLEHRRRSTVRRMNQGRLELFVDGRLSVIVQNGKQIRAGEVHEGEELSIIGDGQGNSQTIFRLYTAVNPTSRWSDDAGVVEIGSVMVLATPGDVTRVDLSFGESEIRATIVNKTAGTTVPATIQYDFRRLAANAPSPSSSVSQGCQQQ